MRQAMRYLLKPGRLSKKSRIDGVCEIKVNNKPINSYIIVGTMSCCNHSGSSMEICQKKKNVTWDGTAV